MSALRTFNEAPVSLIELAETPMQGERQALELLEIIDKLVMCWSEDARGIFLGNLPFCNHCGRYPREHGCCLQNE